MTIEEAKDCILCDEVGCVLEYYVALTCCMEEVAKRSKRLKSFVK